MEIALWEEKGKKSYIFWNNEVQIEYLLCFNALGPTTRKIA